MSVVELLAQLRELDAHIELDRGRLRLNAPTGAVPDGLRRELRERKPEIIAFLHSAQTLSQQQRAIIPLETKGTREPIFAVAGHNGDVFCYRALVQHLGPDQPFFGLQPPGLEEGVAPHSHIEELAAYFAGQIHKFCPAGPITIAGYCAGGTVAFELARQLSDSGRAPSSLILFGAPYCASYRTLPELADRCSRLVERAATHSRALGDLPVSEWRSYLVSRTRARRAAATGAPRDPVMIRRAAVERATVAAIQRYRPGSFPGHLDLMLPCEAYKGSWDAPLRWNSHAATTAEYVGPNGCTADAMLLPKHAGTFAEFVKSALETRPR